MRGEGSRLGGSRWAALPLALAALLCLPAAAGAVTYTVDDAGDASDADFGLTDANCDGTAAAGCTLRAAIETAQGPHSTGDDIVELPFDVAISLGSFSFFDYGALIVRGTDDERSEIDANDSSRIFNVSGVPLTLENVELREGADLGNGGAIHHVAGDATDVLRLEDAAVEDSSTTSDTSPSTYGGGIYVTGSSPTLQLVDAEIIDNSAGDDGSGGGDSGQTSGAGAGVALIGDAPTLSVSAGSSISSNTALGRTTGTGATGGGVAVVVTDDTAPHGSISVTGNSILDGNRAGGNGSSVTDYGGGIYVQGFGAVSPALGITASTISNNTAGGGSGNAEGRGGGVMVTHGGGPVTLNGADFNGNRAGGDDNSSDGTGAGRGGALYSASDVSSTDGSFFLANRAGVATTGTVDGQGGAVALDSPSGPDLEITDSFFQQNLAGTGNSGNSFGGAVNAQGAGRLEVAGSNFVQNQAQTYGGAISRFRNGAAAQPDTVTNSGFTTNTARLYGGAIAGTSDTSMTISGAEIAFNTATTNHGGGIFFTGSSPAASPPQLTIRNATISQNQAPNVLGQGGGIALTFAGTPVDLQLTGSTLSDNSAQGSGGSMDIVGEPAGDTPVIRIRGSIVEGGTSTFGSPNCQLDDADIDYASEGGNIESGTDCDFTLAGMGDLQSTDPDLQALADNGEVGQSGSTHAILVNSPAVGNVPDALCSGLATDQRGVGRPQGLGCDSGAYEFIPPATTTTLSCTPSPATVGSASSCTASVVPTGGGFPAGTVSFAAAGPGGTLSAPSCTLAALTGTSLCKVAYTPSAAGSHSLTASYTGAIEYGSSQDGTVLQATAPPSAKKKCKKGQKRKKVKGKVKCVKKKRKKKKGKK